MSVQLRSKPSSRMAYAARILFLALMALAAAGEASTRACQELFDTSASPAKLIPIQRRISKTAAFYLEKAEWLRENAKSIDPKKSHLQALVPLAEGLIKKIETDLANKQTEPLYAEREPLIREVFSEIRARIENHQLTYEYIACLPFRFGFLLSMSGKTKGLAESADPATAFETASYVNHSQFIKLVELSADYQRTSRSLRNATFHSLSQALKQFPSSPMLPVFGNISYRTINLLTSLDVWTIGVTTHRLRVDDVEMDEFLFPLHDLGHREVAKDTVDGINNIPEEAYRSFDRRVVQLIESANVSETDFEILHFLHFLLIHETSLPDFVYRDENGKRTALESVQTAKHGIEHMVGEIESICAAEDLATNQGLVDKLSSFEKVLKGRETRQHALKRVMPIYRRMVSDAVSQM